MQSKLILNLLLNCTEVLKRMDDNEMSLFVIENQIRLANTINGVYLEISSTNYSTIISGKSSLKTLCYRKHRVQKEGKK